jgi:hypothetical protein
MWNCRVVLSSGVKEPADLGVEGVILEGFVNGLLLVRAGQNPIMLGGG